MRTFRFFIIPIRNQSEMNVFPLFQGVAKTLDPRHKTVSGGNGRFEDFFSPNRDEGVPPTRLAIAAGFF